MSPTDALRHVVHVVADGTGRSPEELWVLGAASIALTVSAMATRTVIRLVDLVTHP